MCKMLITHSSVELLMFRHVAQQEMEQLLSTLKAARENAVARLAILNQLDVTAGVTCAHLLAHLDKV